MAKKSRVCPRCGGPHRADEHDKIVGLPQDSTFMRFEVEINMPGFPEDDGEARAAEIKQALLDTAKDFDIEATVKETTE